MAQRLALSQVFVLPSFRTSLVAAGGKLLTDGKTAGYPTVYMREHGPGSASSPWKYELDLRLGVAFWMILGNLQGTVLPGAGRMNW